MYGNGDWETIRACHEKSMREAKGRDASPVGIRSSTHFNRYYLSPLLEKGVIARTDPDHPQSPQQRYCLT